MRPGKHIHPPGAGQRGVGLVEIMIGLTLGLLLLIALGYIFLASKQTTNTQDDLSRMQETGRLALDTIGETIRHAGYAVDFENEFKGSHPGVAWMVATDGGGSGATASADSLTVRYDALVTGDTDCVGTSVAGGAKPANLVVATYALSGTDLRCTGGTTAPPAPLFSNIENLQVEYGLDTDGDNAADSYVTGAGVANIDQVVAIRVHLLVRSERDNISPVKQTYTFNSGSATASDYRLRQEYVATYALRNRLP